MYEVKRLTEEFPKLELHYVANPKPDAHNTKSVYRRESPHVKKHLVDARNRGIVPNEKTHQSSSNKNSCSGAVSDYPNASNETNEECFTNEEYFSNWGTLNLKINQWTSNK